MAEHFGLNPEQLQAVKTIRGPLMILAGAGTGKTRVITCRIAHMISNGISPENIAAVTFTNKAAKEMLERITGLLPFGAKLPRIGTFHSFCLDILRKFPRQAGLAPRFTIVATSDQVDLVKRALEEKNWQTQYYAERILYQISSAKNCLLTPDDVAAGAFTKLDPELDPHILATVYELYERQLHLNRVIDFDDCILRTYQLLKNDADVLKTVRDRFQYLLVDEFQDTNAAQLTLLHMLAQEHQNICVVGDDDQSIYSWRGAVTENLQLFEELFPNPVQIKLEQNYRCSNTILNAANTVIKNNVARKDKTLWSKNATTQDVVINEFDTDATEARWVAEKTFGLLGRGIPASNIAVLYRANAQARAVELAMREFNIRYKVYGGQSFFERKEIKDFLAYLRLLANPDDRLAFWRAVNTPPRGLGLKSLELIDQISAQEHCSPHDACTKHADKLPNRVKPIVAEFTAQLQTIRSTIKSSEDLEAACQSIIKTFQFEIDIKLSSKDAGATQRKLEALRRMPTMIKDAAHDLLKDNPRADWRDIIDKLTLGEYERDDEDKNNNRGQVSLMTVHASKGLEYQVVFVIGVEDGQLPHKNSVEAGEIAIAEERRLFYVALTRAKEYLFVSYSLSKMTHGETLPRDPSRFLAELPEAGIVRNVGPGVRSSGQQKVEKVALSKRLSDFKASLGKANGFSLVELICVVAIVALLAQLSMTSFEVFIDRAKNAEASTNLGVTSALVRSYFDSGAVAPPGAFTLQNLSQNVYTTATSCNYTNAVGFSIKNCKKTNFVYGLGYSSATNFSTFAVEGGTIGAKRIQPKCKGASLWLNHSASGLKHSIDTTNGTNCNTCFIITTMSKLGSSDLAFDFDGDGSVTIGDTSAPAGWFEMSPSFGTPLTHIGDC